MFSGTDYPGSENVAVNLVICESNLHGIQYEIVTKGVPPTERVCLLNGTEEVRF